MDLGPVGRPDGEAEPCAANLAGHRATGAKKNEIKPWLKEQWCIPPEQSAEFVWPMEEVLDVYQRPLDRRRPVVCLDEKPVQLLADVRQPLPPSPGQPARQDYEYKREGTANLFVAFEPLTNWRQIQVTRQRTRLDFAAFLTERVEKRYRQAEKIILVMDNLNTHSPASLYVPGRRLHGHRAGTQPIGRRSGLAVHCRWRPHQAQETLSINPGAMNH
ncbi:MAG: IS630 family transposase [Planctomycetota bacterium]|nr:IS630 family transposase [Planctomycetota bacterium]